MRIKQKSDSDSIKKRKKKENPEKSKSDPDFKEPDQHSFDFGGLPQRDLKKNLGCG